MIICTACGAINCLYIVFFIIFITSFNNNILTLLPVVPESTYSCSMFFFKLAVPKSATLIVFQHGQYVAADFAAN